MLVPVTGWLGMTSHIEAQLPQTKKQQNNNPKKVWFLTGLVHWSLGSNLWKWSSKSYFTVHMHINKTNTHKYVNGFDKISGQNIESNITTI